MPDSLHPASPGRGVWLMWALAFVGGLVVLGAVAVALLDPCLQDGQALASGPCAGSSRPRIVLSLATGGTLLAVIGGLGVTVMTLRRTRR